MSKEYNTYLNYSRSEALWLHGEPKPVVAETYIVDDESTEFSLDNLKKIVMSSTLTVVRDDFASFKGRIVEPPEFVGKSALLTVRWQRHDSAGSTLVIQD